MNVASADMRAIEGALGQNADDVARAMLNILEDFAEEKSRLAEVQRASLNILEDFTEERKRLAELQRATLNVLEDFTEEKRQLEEMRRVSLNILEDFDDERHRLGDVQRASLNILEDFADEKAQLRDVQRAMLNILEDFEAEKAKVVLSNRQLEASNKELESFSYSVSHDLRAPLRGMDAFARILDNQYSAKMGEEERHCLSIIIESAQKMGQLIDDLLAFSHLHQEPLVTQSVQHSALVQAVLKELIPEAEGRDIDLKVEELGTVQADARLLKQVWINLIGNALKYTRTRKRAEIRIGSKRENGVLAYFIQDNGVGFDMRYAHKLFGVFQRLHRAEDYEGTGVGLAIVHRIIAGHGGRVWASAVKGEGATFYFTLQGANEP